MTNALDPYRTWDGQPTASGRHQAGLANAEAYALRYSANRPVGRYATVDEAVAAGEPGAAVVTIPGAWIVGTVIDGDHS